MISHQKYFLTSSVQDIFFSLVIVLPAAGRDWSYTDSLVKGCGNGAAGMNRRAGTLGTSGIQSGCV